MSRRLHKISFDRHAGLIFDLGTFKEKRTFYASASVLGEAITDIEREEARSEALAGNCTAIVELPSEERPKDYLEILLRGLRKNDSTAANALLEFHNLAKVRNEIFEFALEVDNLNFGMIARVLSYLANKRIRNLLNKKFNEIGSDKMHLNYRSIDRISYLISLSESAEALLRIDPDATEAAMVLISLLREPRGANGCAARSIASVFRLEMRTNAMIMIRDAVLEAMKSKALNVFLSIADAAAQLNGKMVLDRLKRFLRDRRILVRSRAAEMLGRIRTPAAFSILMDRLLHEQNIEQRILLASILGPLVPQAFLVDVCSHALAYHRPFVRFQAVLLLRLLHEGMSQRIASSYGKDEPDEGLRRLLLSFK